MLTGVLCEQKRSSGPLSSGMSLLAWNNVEVIVKLVKIATYEIVPGAELTEMLFFCVR